MISLVIASDKSDSSGVIRGPPPAGDDEWCITWKIIRVPYPRSSYLLGMMLVREAKTNPSTDIKHTNGSLAEHMAESWPYIPAHRK